MSATPSAPDRVLERTDDRSPGRGPLAGLFGLAAASFGISLGIGVIFPLVPIFARDAGISLTAVGSLVGAFGCRAALRSG